ncbi:MAG: nickel pincer cofactor biosynthesis protein LarC [Actinomycetota bacterium]
MIAYLDCFSGASGDMILGALIDAGADLDAVRKQVERLNLKGVGLEVQEVTRSGLRATQVLVPGGDNPAASDLRGAREIISQAGLDEPVESAAIECFEALERSEARVHGGESGFHEIGQADTFVDVVGTAAALVNLGVERVSASPIPLGTGSVETAHGLLPLPAPAVTELLRGARIVPGPEGIETVTPTGAAILSRWVSDFGPPPPMTISSVGFGAGAREHSVLPNVLRVLTGVAREAPEEVEVLLLEANIDDLNPEIYTYVTEQLFAAGADDVWIVPVIGKHGRPATVLSALAAAGLEHRIKQMMFRETSTIGVRTTRVAKAALARGWIEVRVEGLPVRVKVAREAGRAVNFAPEYADCAEVARRSGLPIKEVFRRAAALAEDA